MIFARAARGCPLPDSCRPLGRRPLEATARRPGQQAASVKRKVHAPLANA
jgi:hypothetical protein